RAFRFARITRPRPVSRLFTPIPTIESQRNPLSRLGHLRAAENGIHPVRTLKSMPTWPPTDYREIRRIAITAIFSDNVLFECVVLKGGNALSLALGIGDRTSLDLDFSIENDFEDLDDIRNRIQRALENRFLAAGYVVFDFRFDPKPSVLREGQSPRWGGYMASFKVTEKSKHETL